VILKNHPGRLALAGLVALALSGCHAQTRPEEPTAAVEASAASDVAATVSSFEKRLTYVQTNQGSGDPAAFTASRDSLVADVNAFIRNHPHAESSPDFVRLLNSLSALDTLTVDQVDVEAFSAVDDSVAMANATWEVAGTSGPLFAESAALFPEIRNSRVDFWITYFTGPGRERFERAMYRMQLHRPTVEAILGEMGLPQELICIAFIESGFAMRAVSTASAVGPWQFISGTGRRYGLRTNWWYDERCDIVASTYAAGHYLQDLHGIWGDWFLAFAAYNCGEYRVARQVARQKTTDFWSLDLPLQTEHYVPKFLAALYIMREPAKYGFTIPSVEPNRFDHVMVTEATDIEVLARCAGTSADIIKDMNPALRRGSTPPNMDVHVKVPAGQGEAAAANLLNLPAEDRVSWREHKVKKGETLSAIASKYGTSVEALRDTNGMRRKSMLRVGQMLMIPVAGGSAAASHPDLANSKPTYMNPPSFDKSAIERYAQRHVARYGTSSSAPAGKEKVVYTVKRNDTLGAIASRYGTSVSKIRSWNDLSRRHIYPGQRLKIYVASSSRSNSEKSEPAATSSASMDESRFEKSRHVVSRGESMYSISKLYGVSVGDLMSWNGRSRNSTIRPGDVLVVWKPRAGGSTGGAPNPR